MKFEINTNTLINEIMANNTSAVMLFAPTGTGKTDFLTELACRYRTVFWFSAVTGNINMFTYYLIDKVLKDDPKLSLKLNQLLYCKSEFNGDSVAITAVLNYISNIKGNCLMVFERMECLPADFDLTLIERLIKHCPPNLKIVVSSDKYIDFDYTKFEPLYPKLIDDTILLPRDPEHDFENYLRDITEQDKAFLVYISDLVSVNIDFIKEIYPKGADLLHYLSRKESYVATRDIKIFRINTLLRNYLGTLKDRYSFLNTELNKIPVKRRYADFQLRIKNYLLASEYYYQLGDYDKLDICARETLNDQNYLMRMADYAEQKKHYDFEDKKDKKYYRMFYSFLLEARGEYASAQENLIELQKVFERDNEVWLEIIALQRIAKLSHKLDPEDKSYFGLIIDRMEKLKDSNPDMIKKFTASVIQFRKDLNLSLSDIESVLEEQSVKDSFLYIKGMEELAGAYFDMGNYKKAMEVTRVIKYYLPWYVIPHNLIAFRYYAGEIDVAEKLSSEALRFALENDITKDISLLYCTLGMVDLYYGRIDEALEKYDTAVRLDKNNDAVKFYNIGQRCIMYAKYKDPNYAKEVAHIYLKYCESFYPKYSNMLQLALSFCYLRLGDAEKAHYYATKCVQSSKSRTTNWLIGMAIATNYMLNKGDLKDGVTLVRNILRSSYNYGMEMILVDYYYDIFDGLLTYARDNNIELEYIARIENILSEKTDRKVVSNNLKVMMFGDVLITVGGKEIQWKTRKSKDLFLHYLLAKDAGIDRNIIIDFLWKDYLYESAINNLKTTNNIIRKTLSAYNIDYSLDYVNSKYVLKIKNLDSDYVNFNTLKDRFTEETSLLQRVEYMNSMLKIYKNDFALDVQYKEFIDERKRLKQEMVINLLKLIRALAKQGEYLEAKRFLSSLVMIDKQNDYSHMISELDAHINLTR